MKKAKRYVVMEDILPDALIKTAAAKDLLRSGVVESPSAAARALGISRSTFYKYRNGISGLFDFGQIHIVNISLLLDHVPGTLSAVVTSLAAFNCNVLTINQGLPSMGTAVVTLSLGLEGVRQDAEEILETLENVPGVEAVKLDGVN